MEHSTFDSVPESCGKVAVGCTEIAGIVQEVIVSSSNLRTKYEALQSTGRSLEEDQQKVAKASAESRILSERAIEHLEQGTSLIEASLGEISGLLELVDTLTQHVTGFAAAMEEVRRCSQNIDQIAETTNILALNATIEAMRAGDAGRTFAVVANEVKALAGETRRATEEISRTIVTLGTEAESVIKQIENSAEVSKNAKTSVGKIEETIGGVVKLVSEVDRQNDQIARATGTINDHVRRVQDGLVAFDNAALAEETKLQNVHRRMGALEATASEMFDCIVKAGLSPKDSAVVDRAQKVAEEIAEIANAAVEAGTINIDDFFDQNYRPVPGSNPPLFRTALSDWADEYWRPVLNRATHEGEPIRMCSLADMNGFLPTHVDEHSQKPNGNLAHDTKYCRNGRILFSPHDKKAKLSSAPYMMAVYRQEGDGENQQITRDMMAVYPQEGQAKNKQIVRDVYIPLYIKGRRWGDFEMAYSLDM